jgi:hypothetical protein
MMLYAQQSLQQIDKGKPDIKLIADETACEDTL